MKTYTRNILISIFYYSCFGVTFNFILFVFSKHFFRDFIHLITAINFKITKDLENSLTNFIIDNEIIIVFLEGILSHILFAIIVGLIFTFLSGKIEDSRTKKNIFNRTLRFTVCVTIFIVLIMLLSYYIWAVIYKDRSWYSEEIVFENHILFVWMVQSKCTYMIVGVFAGIIYFLIIKPKSNLKNLD